VNTRRAAAWLAAVLCAMASTGVAFAAAAEAPGARQYQVAMVLPRPEGETERAFEEYFAKRGFPLTVTVVPYSGRSADRPALIAQLRRLGPDLIYTWDTATTLAVAGPVGSDAGSYIHDIPVVFTAVSDPVAAGLVTNLTHPGRNLIGVIPLAPLAVQINAIGEYRPLHTLGLVYDGSGRQTLAVRDHLRELAREQGFALLEEPIPLNPDGEPDAAEIPSLVASLKTRGADFLYIGPETFIRGALQDVVVLAALAARLPSFCPLESAVRRHGALFGLVSPPNNVGRFAAFKAMRVLQGQASPADMPIETLQHFSPLINMQTALHLQVYPPLLLLDVAEVTTGGVAPGTQEPIPKAQ
jgi:putative tryptophan/tyrosine transport system substrate-binding protein